MRVEHGLHASNDGGQKLLSLVVSGRNDEYMGNFKYRITTCLNYLARHLADLGRLDDVEVLVTDWGSTVPLAKVLPLSPEAGHICRFVYVPPSITSIVRPDGDFSPYWAANVGLRRGKGEFWLLSDADCLFPRQSLQTLLNLLDGKLVLPFDVNRTFFYFCRHQVPWEIVQRQPTLDEWDRYLLLAAGSLPRDQGSFGLGIFGSGQMMHRSMWHECRGYDQRLIGQAWGDAELTLRVAQCYPWMDLSGVGISAFHMMHWPHNRPGVWRNAVTNPPIVSPAMRVNDENWGLANYQLDVQVAENIIGSPQTTESLEAANPIEPWGQTKNELVSELVGHSVREHVQRSFHGWGFDPAEWESLCALSWYGLYHYPRVYVEFGIRKASAAVVAAACPGVEIYGINLWEVSGHDSASSPLDVAFGLQRVGHRGYLRFVNGEPQTAFRRLRDSFIGRLSFDLALVRGDIFGPDTIQQLDDLVPHLAPGGMIVFTCASTVGFQPVWKEMQDKFAKCTYLLCKSGRTGLILAASLQDDGSNAPSSGDNDLRVNFGKLPRPCLVGKFIRRAFRAMMTPSQYPAYAKRIWHVLLEPDH